MKRRVAWLLILAIVLSALPFPAMAEEDSLEVLERPLQASSGSWDGTAASGFAGGSGTEADPYYISNAKELAYLAKSVNSGNNYSGKYIEVVANIDIAGSRWTPIGTISSPFRGVFQGNGYTISGMELTDWNYSPTDKITGLFGVNRGTISDLLVKSGSTLVDLANFKNAVAACESGDWTVGKRSGCIGFVAGVNYGTVKNVSVSCDEIWASYSSGTTESKYNFCYGIGGVVGYNYSTVSYCDFTGKIRADQAHSGGLYIGGVAGASYNGTVTGCWSSCVLDGDFKNVSTSRMAIGGVIGYSSESSISNCYAYPQITANVQHNGLCAGGLVGYAIKSTIAACYTSGGKVFAVMESGNNNYGHEAGGLVGTVVSSSVSNCYSMLDYVYCTCGGNYTTEAGKLIGQISVLSGGAEPTINNCYVSNSTEVTTTQEIDKGCDGTSYETIEEATNDYGVPVDAITSTFLVNTLGWGMYKNYSDAQSNPKNIWVLANSTPVLFTTKIFTLTIRYLEDDGSVYSMYFNYYDPAQSYNIVSPDRYGYKASPAIVSGTITGDLFVDVHYAHAHVGGNPATCTSEQRCTLCGAVMAEKIPHSYAKTIVEPDCDTSGYSQFTCSFCSDTYKDEFVEPNGHQLDDECICTVCGKDFEAPLIEYNIYLKDHKTEKPLSGVNVKLGESSVTTDREGKAKFQLEDGGVFTIEISSASYKHTVNNYTLNDLGYDCLYLESGDTVISGAWCNGDNVLIGEAQINAKAHALKAKIVVSGSSKDKIDRYELISGDSIIATGTNGSFEVMNPYFKIGKDVYVRMYTSGTNTNGVFERKLNIKVVGYVFNFESDLAQLLPFSQGLKMTFPDGTPGFAGYELKFTNPFLKTTDITYRHENDKILIFFGFDHDYAEDPDLEYMKTEELFKKLIDDWASEKKSDKTKEVHGSLALAVEFSEEGLTKVYGQINVGFHLDFAKGQTFMVGVIPVYGEIALSLEGELEVSEIGIDTQAEAFLIPTYETTLGGDLTLFAGIGCHVASVGVYGQVGVELVLSSDQESAFEKFSLWGEMGVYAKIKLLFFKELCYKYALLRGEKTWPDHMTLSKKLVYSIDQYDTDTREYLEERTEWLNRLLLSREDDTTVLLQDSTYTAIEPQVIPCGDTFMMLFLDDDGSEGLNYQHLYYSLYNKANGTWSTPQRVDDNDRPDVEFDVYADGDGIYLAYTELAPIAEEDGEDYAKILSTAEVAAAQYDFAEGSFVNYTVLSQNDTFDTLPKISETASGLSVAWVNNFTNELFSQNANNEVYVSTLSGGQWSAARALGERGATVVSMDVGSLDGKSYVACIQDVDCDLSTIGDRHLNLMDFVGNVMQIPMEHNANDNVQFVTMNGATQVIWYNDGNLYAINSVDCAPAALFDSAVEGLTSRYKFLPMDSDSYAVLYTKNEQSTDAQGELVNGSDIYGIFCHDGVWGQTVPVTQNEAGYYVDSYDAFLCEGKLVIPYVNAQTTFTEDDILKRTAFVCKSFELKNDLVAGGAQYRPADLFGGESIEIRIPVTNYSWQSASGVSYAVKDSQGNEIFSGRSDLKIGSGSTETIVILLPKSLLREGESYMVDVRTPSWEEEDESNNRVDLSLWYTDFSISASQFVFKDSKEIRYSITNDGNVSGSAKLYVYKLTDSGRVEINPPVEIPDLGVGQTVSGAFTVTQDYYADGSESGMVILAVLSDKEERYLFNDSLSLTVGGIERGETTPVDSSDTLSESPVIATPYLRYDPMGADGASVSVDEKGWTFLGISELAAQSYSYAKGLLTLNKDYLATLGEGYHTFTLSYSKEGKTTEALLIVEIVDSGYGSVDITAHDQVMKYDGFAAELGIDLLYSTPSKGALSCEYSVDGGSTWIEGLPARMGVYLVRLMVAQDDNNKYFSADCTLTFTIEKGCRAISVPLVTGSSDQQVLFGDSIPTAGKSDGAILYGYSLTNDVTSVSQWMAEGKLPVAQTHTTYYVFAKIVGGENYEDAFSLGYAVDAHVHKFESNVNASAPNHATGEKGYTGDTQCLGCGEVLAYGQAIEPGAHLPSDVWAKDESYHWKECGLDGCNALIDGTKEMHISNRVENKATCQKQAVCDVCGVSYGKTADHDLSSEWSKDESGHWHLCQTDGCREKGEFSPHIPDHPGGASEEYAVCCSVCAYVIHEQISHTHVFDEKLVDPKYLKSEATCTEAASYYMSCECGERGEELFYHGEVAGHEHSDFWDTDCNRCGEARTRPLIGDANGDGNVNFSDIQRIYKHVSADNPLMGDSRIIADANKDGNLNFSDIQRIYQHLSTANKLF